MQIQVDEFSEETVRELAAFDILVRLGEAAPQQDSSIQHSRAHGFVILFLFLICTHHFLLLIGRFLRLS
jgi:hypothetical protein